MPRKAMFASPKCKPPDPTRPRDRQGKSLNTLRARVEPIAHPFMQIGALVTYERFPDCTVYWQLHADGTRGGKYCRIRRNEPNYPLFKE